VVCHNEPSSRDPYGTPTALEAGSQWGSGDGLVLNASVTDPPSPDLARYPPGGVEPDGEEQPVSIREDEAGQDGSLIRHIRKQIQPLYALSGVQTEGQNCRLPSQADHE